MSKKIYYEVSIGGMYNDNIRFDSYEKAKVEYDDVKSYTRDLYIGLSKITIETLESDFIEYDEEEEDE